MAQTRIKKTIVISLGGSLIIPDSIDIAFLKKFRTMVLNFSRRGYRFIIVTGGGQTARQYQRGAQRVARITPENLDWIGIAATKINAELVRSVFGSAAYHTVLPDPTTRVRTTKRILIGCGWHPGFSSDKDAVLLAHTFGADQVINMSNISYVYTADPKKHPSAKRLTDMSWDQLLQITGRTWKPGAHVPFDPEAAKFAQAHGISAIVCWGSQIANIRNIISGKPYRGTTIRG